MTISYTTLDLSTLPAPWAVEPWTFDAILSDSVTNFLSYWSAAQAKDPTLPAYTVQTLKGNPVNFVLSAGAFREGLLRQRVNEAVLQVMWASSTGSDLDQLGALVGLGRRTITPEDDTTTPITPAVMESDAEFRARGPFALDATAIGFAGGTYRSIVLSASPAVKAVAIVRGAPGEVALILQGRNADGSIADADAAAVRAIIVENDQLTDVVSVRSAAPLPYAIVAHVTVPPGPAIGPVQATAVAGLTGAASALQIIGANVPTDALIAAGRLPAMAKFTLVSPPADLVVAPDQISYATSVTVNVSVVDE